MLKLRNKTRAASKVGYLVKAVRGGFVYAGAGDTPIGVVTEVVPSGSMCNIQTEGKAMIYVGETVAAGAELRMPTADSGGIAGQVYNIGTESVYVSVGYTVEGGRGLVEISLNIGSNAGTGGGVNDHTLLTNIGVNTHAQIDTFIAAGSYSNWIVEAAGVPVQTVSDGDAVNFVAGSNMTVSWGGPNTLTFAMTTSFGNMDDWYMAVDYDPGTPVTHTIQNHTIVDFQGGTYIDAAYTFVAPVHGVAFDINLTAMDGRYTTLAYLAANYEDTTTAHAWVSSNFDNYANWVVEAGGVPVQTVSSGNAVNFAAGANMTVTWGGPDTLTFAMTTAFGTMSSWQWEIEGVAHGILNGGTAELIAGTGISIAYTLGGVGEHQATITNSDPSKWTTTAGGIYYSGGNVGIGTTSPDTLLHIESATSAVFRLSSSDTSLIDNQEIAKIEFEHADSSNPGVAGAILGRADGVVGWMDLVFQTGYGGSISDSMVIASSGRVSIYDSTPTARLYINNNQAYQMSSLATAINEGMAFRVRGRDTSTYTLAVSATNTDEYGIQVVNDAGTAGGDLALQPFGGNVGVGTLNPAYTLDVNGTGRFVTSVHVGANHTLKTSVDRSALLYIQSAFASGYNGIQIPDAAETQLWSVMGQAGNFGLYDDTAGEWHVNCTANSNVTLYYNGSARCNTTGEGFMIGNFSQDAYDTYPERKRYLKISNPITYGVGQVGLQMYNNTHGWDIFTDRSSGYLRFEKVGATPTALGTEYMYLSTSGLYHTGEIESYDTSDIRIKENVMTMPYGRSMQLLDASVIEYDHKLKKRHDIGLIAQEIQEIFPEAVKERASDGMLMIRYDKLIAPVLQIIQEQQREINALKELLK